MFLIIMYPVCVELSLIETTAGCTNMLKLFHEAAAKIIKKWIAIEYY